MTAITERSATDLAAAIRRDELTCSEVVVAHIEQLTRTNQFTNAVAADRYEQAVSEAAAADDAIARSAARGDAPDPLLPLLGVPFTVKESIAVSGMPHSAGVKARSEYRATEHATAVQRLVDAGAIPLAVTNTSELTLWIESHNAVYGRTSNPYDSSRTAGGSSGGEGAAVGSGGVPFGIGADIGGSIRVPALFCGVFGHKPSSGLVPNTGLWPGASGHSERMLATGPLARRAEDLMPLLHVLAGPDGVDEITAKVDLGDPGVVTFGGLQVTLVEDATRVGPSRDMVGACERAAGALAAAGANVRTVSLRSWRNSLLPYLSLMQGTEAGAADELLVEAGSQAMSWRDLLLGHGDHTLPTRVAVAAERIASLESGSQRAWFMDKAAALAAELEDAVGDGILLHPAHRSAASLHKLTYGQPWLLMPAAIFNLGGLPVTEVPMGLNRRGLPVGVQIAARHGADHLTIAAALELERVFGGWVPPGTASAAP